jgi:hypothetical protein
VSSSALAVFVAAVGGSSPNITLENVDDLRLLCDEFQFSDLALDVQHWLSSHSPYCSSARRQLCHLERRVAFLEGAQRDVADRLSRLNAIYLSVLVLVLGILIFLWRQNGELSRQFSELNSTVARPRKHFPVNVRVLDGIIAHLTRECRGSVHDKGIVVVTSSAPLLDDDAAKNVADLESPSSFASTCRSKTDDIPHEPNN